MTTLIHSLIHSDSPNPLHSYVFAEDGVAFATCESSVVIVLGFGFAPSLAVSVFVCLLFVFAYLRRLCKHPLFYLPVLLHLSVALGTFLLTCWSDLEIVSCLNVLSYCWPGCLSVCRTSFCNSGRHFRMCSLCRDLRSTCEQKFEASWILIQLESSSFL